MLNGMVFEYNKIAEEMDIEKAELINNQTTVRFPCRITDFLVGSYAKFPETDNSVIMEYAPLNNYLVNYLPAKLSQNEGFKRYLLGTLTEKAPSPYNATLFSFADVMMYTLPAPRYKYYESANFDIIKANVLKEVDKAVMALGYYTNFS